MSILNVVSYEFFLDLIFIILLSVMIISSLRLNKQIKIFRAHQQDFKELFGEFNHSFGRADDNIQNIKSFAQQASHEMEQQIYNGKVLADDLRILIEAGNKLADRLEIAVDNARYVEKRVPKAQVPQSREEMAPDVNYYKTQTNYQQRPASGGVGSSSLKSDKKIIKPFISKVR